MNIADKTAPKRIWLQPDGRYEEAARNRNVTWCQNRVNEDDVEYIRVDLVLQWQPIETAPRQETVLFGSHALRGWFCIGAVNALGEITAGYSGETKPDYKPTHWMPLYEPPEDER